MGDRSPTFHIRARGPEACFTRPELKVERVSYEVMTPSAARGLLEAIFWKPAINWQVERIHVLNEIRFNQLKRNEVSTKLSPRGDHAHFYADDAQNRAQRNTLFLRAVDYIIDAHFVLTEKKGERDNLAKFVDMFQRRLEKSQHYHQPYLGCREFVAEVEPAPAEWQTHPSLAGIRPLGLILYDIVHNKSFPHICKDCKPLFFSAVMRDGVLEVPPPEEVMK
ncbi:MAG: type I-C CRISPR-associated protein Cas5c [Clostridiales bacterium]|nr:type I-C CRISPR-associated protein Cas5c [Clostridiales bacterium]